MAEDQENTRTQIITNKGLVLLGESQLEGANQSYWLGYFGFAYVPDEAKTGDDKLAANMPKLTTKGDMIYNIWQGSMTPNGCQTDITSSNADDLYNQCQYTNSITANFRYAVDKTTGKNTLTLYRRGDNGKLSPWGDVVEGTGINTDDEVENSALPVPAPLFYKGNGTAADLAVTGDPRNYEAKAGMWGSSSDAWNPVPTNLCDDTAKTNISNFNKYHAPAISDGYMVGKEPSCRNMATVTKYFPVAHYTVESTEGSKVAALKLKLVVDLNNIASKVSDRTNYADVTSDLSPVGFKFNRIGIYAVPMAVHHYSYEEENAQCIADKQIQYQVIGDEEPVLFAVIDLDQVVTVEEGSSIGKWSQDIVINFGMANDDSGIERNPVVYYNLYEDDSIVWYKNQLIANASSAEAVTNLGIEMNYLKNQIENLRSGETCGLGDSGDEYALVGHTHNFMKNIVDTSEYNNGAVRGIYTKPENQKYTVYKTAQLANDETPDVMFEVDGYSVGDDSMGLGKDSITAGEFSINLSRNGIMSDNTSHTLLMGKSRLMETEDPSDHLALDDVHNSILNLGDSSEIQKMYSSLWIGSADPSITNRQVYIDHATSNSIGIGRVSSFTNDKQAPLYPVASSRTTAHSILMGGIDLYSFAERSLLMLDGERGNSVGIADAGVRRMQEAIRPEAVMEGDSSGHVFGSIDYGGITDSVVMGAKNIVSRHVDATLALGTNNRIAAHTENSVIIGRDNNTENAQRMPSKMITVDEFNAKYSNAKVAEDDYDFDLDVSNNFAQIVGDGTITAMNDDGTTLVRDVKGISLYVSYSRSTGIWSTSTLTRDQVYSYQLPGHDIRNMLVLGNSNSLGHNSANSIVLGDSIATKNITFKNSFITDAESERPELSDIELNHPHGTFNNVWWIGHTMTTASSVPSVYDDGIMSTSGDSYNRVYGGHFLTNRWQNDNTLEFKDVFAFVGRNMRQFGYADWYGAENTRSSINDIDGNVVLTREDLYQPCRAPMIYSGGIALGGYGTDKSNFMLLKIGMRGCWSSDYMGMTQAGGFHQPCMWRPNYDEIRNIVYLKNGDPTGITPTVVKATGKYDIYDDFCDDGLHHFQVDSPMAGMALVVQEKHGCSGKAGTRWYASCRLGPRRRLKYEPDYPSVDYRFVC